MPHTKGEKSMLVLVTGASGQLGQDVVPALKARGHEVLAPSHEELDLTKEPTVSPYVKEHRPDAVIHCAAYTSVDRAEEEAETCELVNRDGTEILVKSAEQVGAKFLYISTDYVFSGEGELPFETNMERAPLNVYGLSKLGGERAVETYSTQYFIVRISWVFGLGGNNFVKTILRLADTKEEISVVEDQIGSPTYTADLAPLLVDMIESEQYGVYHATNEGFTSFKDFAEEIVRQSGKSMTVKPITTEEYGAPAKRPLNSRLSKASLNEAGFHSLPTWQNALARFLKALG